MHTSEKPHQSPQYTQKISEEICRKRCLIEIFLQTILTFPTLLWSIVFAICTLYWLVAITGLIDLDSGTDVLGLGGEVDVADAGLNPHGIPIMVIVTILSFFAWITCYFAQLFFIPTLSPELKTPISVAIMALVILPATALSALIMRFLNPIFAKLNAETTDHHALLGNVAVVVTPVITSTSGVVLLHHGGTDLRLQARTRQGEEFKRNEQVILLEYDTDSHTYIVKPVNIAK